MNWDTELLDTILYVKQTTHKSYAQLAEQYLNDRTLGESLRLALRKHRNNGIRPVIPEPEPRLFLPEVYAPMVDTLVIADLHAPYHNKVLLEEAIRVAKAANVEYIDIAGDLHDFNSLSPLSKGEPTTTYETDIRVSRQILTALAYDFKQIRITSGNHDEYYIKKKGGTFKDLIYNEVLQGKLNTQVMATDLDYLFLGDNWLIGHLSSYDEEPGALAAKLSDKYNKNVLVGHDHVRGFKRGIGGKIGVSIGAMLTPDRFYYKIRRLNTFPDFMLGFAIILKGELYLFSDKGNTEFLGKFYPFSYWIDYFKERRYEIL